jgi:hypothetical protein
MPLVPLFKNQSVGNAVTVDIDVPLENFLRPKEECREGEKPGITIGLIREQVIKIEARIDQPVVAQYRRSSKGHVHVRIIFENEITVLDALLLRAYLFDDTVRHSLDKRRYVEWENLYHMNRCFDDKIESGQIYSAGPWISLDDGRDQLTGNAKHDYDQYMRQRHGPQELLIK